MTPQIEHFRKARPILMVSTHIYGVSQGDRWENIHFYSKPRHVTPQIDLLGKMSTVLRVSTHIYGVFQEIDGKMFLLRVKLGMWPLKSIILEKQGFQHTVLRCFITHWWKIRLFWGDRWENVPFESKPRHVTPQIEHLGEKQALFWGFQHTFMVFPRR